MVANDHGDLSFSHAEKVAYAAIAADCHLRPTVGMTAFEATQALSGESFGT